MQQSIQRIISELADHIGSLSEYVEQFDHYLTENLGGVPPPLVYLFCIVIAGLLVWSIAKSLARLAVFVVMPTIGSALVVTYAFPTLEASKVVPIAGLLFVMLFIFKH